MRALAAIALLLIACDASSPTAQKSIIIMGEDGGTSSDATPITADMLPSAQPDMLPSSSPDLGGSSQPDLMTTAPADMTPPACGKFNQPCCVSPSGGYCTDGQTIHCMYADPTFGNTCDSVAKVGTCIDTSAQPQDCGSLNGPCCTQGAGSPNPTAKIYCAAINGAGPGMACVSSKCQVVCH